MRRTEKRDNPLEATKVRRNDWRYANAWLGEHRAVAGAFCVLSFVLVLTFVFSDSVTTRKTLGVPFFTVMGCYFFVKSLGFRKRKK